MRADSRRPNTTSDMQLAEALRITQEPKRADEPNLQVFLACGFTPLHLQTFLNAHLRTVFPQQRVDVETGVYGDVTGNLDKALGKSCFAVIAVLEWADLDARLGFRRLGGWGQAYLPGIVEEVQKSLDRIGLRLKGLAQKSDVIVTLPSLPLPPVSLAPGWQCTSHEAGLHQALANFAAGLAQTPRVRLVNSGYLDSISPLASRYNAKSDLFAGFPYTLTHADALGRILADLVRGPRPKKGLITDLDDTLWKGILGEEGPSGISWQDRAHHHALYQQLLQALANAGVLIAVASKNDPALVEQAFKRTDLILSHSDIFPFEVSWGPKSEAISKILASWNIGADAVVFVDDSAMELAEVKAAHPQVECLQFSKEPGEVITLLNRLRDLCGKEHVSDEDRLRLSSVKAGVEVAHARDAAGGDIDEFLSGVEAEINVSFDKTTWDPRALELINKTNQFNLNGRRQMEAAFRQTLSKDDTFLALVSYRDKYGPLGKIAVITGRRNNAQLRLDSWVMSCRAFSRRIEFQCLKLLFQRFGADEICFDYEPTARNGPLQEFLTNLAGEPPRQHVRVSKSAFREHCPKLYHAVTETTNE